MTGRKPTLARSFGIWKTFRDWHARGYAAPSPVAVKREVLRRHHISAATWVETGTARGDMTDFLSKFAPRVISIEAQEQFAEAARRKFAAEPKIEIHHGTSESRFPQIVAELSGDVCFWLDGHYSGGTTFQGNTDTPIEAELETLGRHLSRLGRVSVLIDDIRCFDPDNPDFRDYPPLDRLVDWARDAGLKWHIEQDVFVALRW